MSSKSHEETRLTRPFQAALYEHARIAARRAHARLGGPLTQANLEQFLTDELCLRYPTRIIFDRTGLEPHQVAQPLYRESREGIFYDLHVDPALQQAPEHLYLVVAYMAAVINYGDAATPELAELLGALLTDIEQEPFYEKLCAIADSVIAVSAFRDMNG
jgi:hypothetical protein